MNSPDSCFMDYGGESGKNGKSYLRGICGKRNTTGDNYPWMLYKKGKINAGETFTYEFPTGFQTRWLRFVEDNDCIANILAGI